MKHFWSFIKKDIRVQCVCLIVPVAIIIMIIAGYSVRLKFSDYLIESLHQSETQNAEMAAIILEEKISPILDKAYNQAINPDVLDMLFSYKDNKRLAPNDDKFLIDCLSSAFNNVKEVNTSWIYVDGVPIETYDKRTEARGFYFTINGEIETLASLFSKVTQSGQTESSVLRDESSDISYLYVGCPILGNIRGKYISIHDVFSVLIVKINFDSIADQLDLFGNGYISNTIVNRDNEIIVSDDRDRIGTQFEYQKEKSEIIQELSFLDCFLYKIIDSRVVDENSALVSTPIIIEYIILTIFLTVLSVCFIHNIIKAFNPLEKLFPEISKGNFEARVDVKGSSQISVIKRHFNNMLDRIVELQQANEEHRKVVEQTLDRQRKAEIETLECQINSHFVFNSLSMIYNEIHEAGLEKPATSITKLSNIIRYAFNQKANCVDLEQEIHWAEQYLSLHKERIGDTFHYEIELDESIAFLPMCKLVLQPFIENAIIHGIHDTSRDCYIQISAFPRDNNFIEISIYDNGCGIPEDRQEILRDIFRKDERPADFGIGLSNVALRIKKFFGEKAAINFSCDQNGTTFIITLPIPVDSARSSKEDINEII